MTSRPQCRFVVMFVSAMLVMMAAAWLESVASAKEEPAGQKFAFLVGISEYESFNCLQYTTNDINAFKDQLVEAGFSPHNITVLSSVGRIAFRPSKRNIEAEFGKMLKRIRPGDVIVCMFAGHGTEIEGEPFFCPEESQIDSIANLQASCVSLKKIMADLEQSDAKFKWMIVDACRNDPTRSVSGARSLGNISAVPSGIMVLQSCASGQQSWEDDQFQHGVFTHFLIEGLKGKAADSGGVVSLLDLCKYATRRTQSHVQQRWSRDQLPYMKGEIADFVLVERSVLPPPVVPPSIASPAVIPPSASHGSPVSFSEGLASGERQVMICKELEYPFRWCPAGQFVMGSPKIEPGRNYGSSEEQQHEVKLSKGFWILEIEVTQEMWESQMGYDPSANSSSKPRGRKLPVVLVSWDECQELIQKLNQQASVVGFKFALPTEAQWEYACRAGTTSPYGGTREPAALGWYTPSYVNEGGQKVPNAWGVYDMHGNVTEWCSDWYDKDYYARSPLADPVGPATGSYRVCRGGSTRFSASNCRSASRFIEQPVNRRNDLGLRLVLVSE